MTRNEAERQEAIEQLRKILKPGDTVWTCVRHVARSGMSRRISVHVNHKGEIANISGQVSRALGWRWCDDGSISVGGCGMDMGFHLVYSLSRVLFPDGFKGNKDGGYALQHHWL